MPLVATAVEMVAVVLLPALIVPPPVRAQSGC